MFFLKILGRFFKALASHASPSGLAWGFALGAIPGLTPLGRLHNLAVLACVMVFRVNGSAALLSFGFFSLFAWMLDPLFHKIGLALLNGGFLYPVSQMDTARSNWLLQLLFPPQYKLAGDCC